MPWLFGVGLVCSMRKSAKGEAFATSIRSASIKSSQARILLTPARLADWAAARHEEPSNQIVGLEQSNDDQSAK